ncbi:hypothetical protein [Streptomyces sp. H34-S4]|uniref:hypothetical protein n=1 Tax=Streptomyces sp. H34-S4 TaxID=2996463 RepID=UPI00226F7C72|nr:hypothetical protein [Streptomyces sp. H34-S4]MCY0933745.1 hypothetical protein [Streptomyces sp. H34-S4]
MPLHTDSAPPAHFRKRVADHGGLTDPPHTESATAAVGAGTTTSGTTNTTTENG